ncbi:MAG: hypothetical protein MR030_06130 [Bacteroidales bacterium]|nr:hypothetical protein [Bacteroidales bacterium]
MQIVTAWRTSCLYGVSDSRASPMHSDGVIFISNILKVALNVLTLSYLRSEVSGFP